jgi:hypothetical protein
VQTLAADFKAGTLTIEQMQRITEEIAKGPLLPAGVAWGLQERYVAVSLLNDQEKAEANLHLQRLARGVWEKKLTMDAFDYVVAEVSEKQPNGSMRPKAQLKLEELKGLLRSWIARSPRRRSEAWESTDKVGAIWGSNCRVSLGRRSGQR